MSRRTALQDSRPGRFQGLLLSKMDIKFIRDDAAIEREKVFSEVISLVKKNVAKEREQDVAKRFLFELCKAAKRNLFAALKSSKKNLFATSCSLSFATRFLFELCKAAKKIKQEKVTK